MDRGVQSESIQYNRVGSKDLSFVDMSKNPLILDGDLVIHVQLPYPRVRQIRFFRGTLIFFHHWIEGSSLSLCNITG